MLNPRWICQLVLLIAGFVGTGTVLAEKADTPNFQARIKSK